MVIHTIQLVFDLTESFFSRRHAGHDLGIENNRIGPTRPYYPNLCLCWVVFSSPHITTKKVLHISYRTIARNLNIAINLLNFYTDFEFHIGFTQKCDFDDFPIFKKSIR